MLDTIATCYPDSNHGIGSSAAGRYTAAMPTAREIRQANLATLIAEHGDQTKLADRCDLAPGHVSQMLNGHRNMGEKVARRIEAKLGLPEGWMDQPHGLDPPPSPVHQVAESGAAYPDLLASDYDFVPRYNVRAAAGPGAEHDHELVETHLAFRRQWLRAKGLRPPHLKVIIASGDSMSGSIEDGDVLLVDTSQRAVKDGMVYAINYDDFVRVKRLFRRFDGTLVLHSDNPATKPQEEEVPPDRLEALTVRIIGRVVWRGGDL